MASLAGDPESYTPPLSLWHLVEQNVSPEEQDEIKSMLGTSLVETTLDLHNEIQMLLEIWQAYREDTKEEQPNPCPLAEPPHVRDRLIQEICFLAESIREKSASKGMNPTTLLSRHNSEILEYAEETRRCGSSLGSARPQSARSSDGRQTPFISLEHANSHFALDSTITEDVFSANGKLNYLHFDEVCNKLRETLTKEMKQLEADVSFLQACLTNSSDQGGIEPLSREPTLTDLKEERSQLEKDLLSADTIPNTPPVHKPPFLPAAAAAASPASAAGKIPALGPVGAKLRPAPTVKASPGATRTAPLKASHHLAAAAAASDSSRPPGKPDRRGCPQLPEKAAGKREGSNAHSRISSAARAKVVPVGSVHEPRVDSAGSRSLMPTPPPVEDMPPVPRPGSAQRFRQMVMSYRE